ncbi:cupin domain-containing protein [Streptomyces montanisoli]|uniref:Cupin domain-containing protein n=1 Tax=Streptomyces montanisoli TaxID=2798581 RepID=A0A940MH24_9ACTN|nr:AraC family transcriptional regulator [Streptomyces montanisoli]MBP0460723.1 cupin domain-containing protein [Streptomyces montanisoli]
MDTLSHLLRLARVEASLDMRCLVGPATRMDSPARAGREAPFHVLLAGSCRLHIGKQVLDMGPGDVVVVPSGAPHRIVTPGDGTPQGTKVTSGAAFLTARSERGGPEVSDLFCGRYGFGAGSGALLFRSLPDPIHVSFGRSPDSADVLGTLSALMRSEAHCEGDGTAAILAGLCTALLAMVLRTARGANTNATLWTAAGDATIASLIERIFEAPGDDWSIERMRRAASMSRATFLRRFGQSTGMTVGAFVTQARLMTAAHLLTADDATVVSVAARVGYRSESAFSRAFRSATGVSPARFRREALTGAGEH